MKGLGVELLGGEMANCPVCAGNSKSLDKSRCSGTTLLPKMGREIKY